MTLNPWALLLHHACRTLFSGCEYTRGYLLTVIMATEAKKQRDRISVLAATRSDTRTHALGMHAWNTSPMKVPKAMKRMSQSFKSYRSLEAEPIFDHLQNKEKQCTTRTDIALKQWFYTLPLRLLLLRRCHHLDPSSS